MGALLIAMHVGFRAWALYRSWFFTDDYRLMLDAQARELTLGYLLAPFDSQFMPLGRLIVWVVVDSGTTNWMFAATLTLALQTLAAAACLFMLTQMFGPRPAILLLLAVYLTSAVALPGFMWWAAALNQLPLQAAIFLAVGCWVNYLRSHRTRWLLLTVAAVFFGLLAYVKAILIVPVLAYIAFAYFASGGFASRLRSVLRDYRTASAIAVTLSVGFAGYYVTSIPQPFESDGQDGATQVAAVADSMLGASLPTGLLGGPWSWFETSPPIVLAQPPEWSVRLAWVVIAGVIAYSALRRQRTGRGWLLLAGYAIVAFVLLATSRGQLYGAIAGSEYRYLTDVLPIAVIAVGLVFLETPNAVESSCRRKHPPLTLAIGRRSALTAIALVALGGLGSSVSYIKFWHQDNASKGYVENVQGDLRRLGTVDLADQVMPAEVMPPYTEPRNRTSVFVPLVTDRARFPSLSHDLMTLAEDGRVVRALISGGTRSRPGPLDGCGWRVGPAGRTVPLEQPTFDYTWWVRIGYLGSADDEVEVTLADTTVETEIRRGLHNLYIEVTGEVDSVTLDGLSPGTTMCVDTVEVGTVVPGGPL